ncbi:MAG: hypothetical protein KGQ41_05690 [Alphaproteobacteria bacterium]|nr:hypothetical protein [Alphaproteobacteria bacterium]
MELTAEEFLKKAGLDDESLAPGQIKYKQHIGEKAGTSYTVVFDWKTDPNKIRVEVRPGLSGEMPHKKELSKFALWLQAENFLELDMTKH